METYPNMCPCIHTVFSRETYEFTTEVVHDCDLCGGSGWAEFVKFENPQNVVRKARDAA